MTNLKVEAAAEDLVKSEVLETPTTAGSDATDKTDSKRSPSPEKPVKTETHPEVKDEKDELKDQTEKMDQDSPVSESAQSAGNDATSNLLEEAEQSPKSEAAAPVVSDRDPVQNEARQESAVTYPESETETDSEGAPKDTKLKPNRLEPGSPQSDVEDMDIEQEGEPYLRDHINSPFSTERIRHTSPISARVLQNVRALKEEILNGTGVNGISSYSSTLDDPYPSMQQERSSSVLAPAPTDVSSSASLHRPGLAAKNDHVGGPQSGNGASRLSFPNNNQSASGPSSRTYQNTSRQVNDTRSWEKPSSHDTQANHGIKRGTDGEHARSFGTEDTRDFKRQRNESPARSWQNTAEGGRNQGRSRSRWDVSSRPEEGGQPDRQPASGGFRGPMQSHDGLPARPIGRPPVNGQSNEYSKRAEEGNRERERSPPRRPSRWDQPARPVTANDRDRPLQNEDSRANAVNGFQDPRFHNRPNPIPPRPSRFSPAATTASRPAVPSHSPSVAGASRLPTRPAARDIPTFPPPAQYASRAPPIAPVFTPKSGPPPVNSAWSRTPQDQRPLAKAEVPQRQPFSQGPRVDATPGQIAGQNRETPRSQERPLPNSSRPSRFSDAPPVPGNQTRGNWNVPASVSLPSLTAANLGRNSQNIPESRTLGTRSISRVSDDGRSALSETKRYVPLDK